MLECARRLFAAEALARTLPTVRPRARLSGDGTQAHLVLQRCCKASQGAVSCQQAAAWVACTPTLRARQRLHNCIWNRAPVPGEGETLRPSRPPRDNASQWLKRQAVVAL